MIFLTVGSALPFERLVRLIDQALLQRPFALPVFAQIGDGDYLPGAMDYCRFLNRQQYEARFKASALVISHAGIGTLQAAISLRKPILVLPRDPNHGELVDNHQYKTAKKFEQLKHLIMLRTGDDVHSQVESALTFEPATRTPNISGVVSRVGRVVDDVLSGHTSSVVGNR